MLAGTPVFLEGMGQATDIATAAGSVAGGLLNLWATSKQQDIAKDQIKAQQLAVDQAKVQSAALQAALQQQAQTEQRQTLAAAQIQAAQQVQGQHTLAYAAAGIALAAGAGIALYFILRGMRKA